MSDFTFDGFEPSNTTSVPDIFFDELLSILSGAEIKVLLYIIRRTLGFKKTTDAISLSQFENGITTHEGKVLDRGCGLNRETICKALKSLELLGCITSLKRTANKNDKDTTLYSIRFKGEVKVVGKSDHVGSRKSELPLVGKVNYRSRKIRPEVVGKSDLQETVIQETVIQETVIQKDTVVAIADDASLTFSSFSNNENGSHSEQKETSSLPANSTTLSEVAPLPSMQPYNTPCEIKADNSTPLSENGSMVPLSQASGEIRIADDAQPQKLLDVPLGPPTMPLDSAKWCPETCVEIVETLLNTRFSEKIRGNSKKQTSPRQRQLEAAKKVYSVVTREEFVRAYTDISRWWSIGALTVVEMAAKCKVSGQMRVVDTIEKLDLPTAKKVIQFPNTIQTSQAERNREIYTGYDFTDLESQFYPTDAQKRAHAAQG